MLNLSIRARSGVEGPVFLLARRRKGVVCSLVVQTGPRPRYPTLMDGENDGRSVSGSYFRFCSG
jgi:hypothetical protein